MAKIFVAPHEADAPNVYVSVTIWDRQRFQSRTRHLPVVPMTRIDVQVVRIRRSRAGAMR